MCFEKKNWDFSVKTENRLIEATKDRVDGRAAPLTLTHSRRDGSERPEKPVVATSVELACTEKGTLLQRHGDLPQYAHDDCRQVL